MSRREQKQNNFGSNVVGLNKRFYCGGALGSYQAGVYQALAEAEFGCTCSQFRISWPFVSLPRLSGWLAAQC